METISMNTSRKHTQVAGTFEILANIFSAVLEEEITPRQAKLILNAILALFVTLFTMGVSAWFSCLTLLWLAVSLWRCKQAGLGEE